MSLPKRQHILPQMLQSRFTDERGHIYVFNKNARDNGVFETTPTNAFVQKHIYSFVNKDGTKDPTLERFYAGLEGQANAIIEKIATAARQGRLPQLTPQEKEAWNSFVYHQWKRSPDFYEKIATLEDFDSTLQETIRRFEATNRLLTDEEPAQVTSPEGKARLMQNARVGALLDPGQIVLNVIGGRGLGIARIKLPNKSFIVGSLPVVKLAHPGTHHIAQPTTEVWLPISSDIAVSPAGAKGTERLVLIHDERHVRAINTAMTKQSSVIAGRSRALIKSLARPK